jgi:DNA-binding CsgD family transcriptional regulator
VLGKSYFDLARAIYRAANFDDLVDLLVAKLPHLIGADEVLVMESSPLSGICRVSDHGPIAKRLGERMDLVNSLTGEHPIYKRVDFNDPGDLGFAMSDYVAPADYRESEFVQKVFGEMAMNDVLFGLLVSGKRRSAYINCYLRNRTYAFQARERFDAILITARGVLDKMEAHNVETAVHQQILLARSGAHMAVFVTKGPGEIFPLNHAAVGLTEAWWGADEATFQIGDQRIKELEIELDSAWENPVTAKWTEVKLDLGGGEIAVQVLPKLNGEMILMYQVPGGETDTEEAILTRRQREIMDWIAEGKTSAEAAIILGISPRTVEKHLEAVFQRLGVENRIAAMRRYLDLRRGTS